MRLRLYKRAIASMSPAVGRGADWHKSFVITYRVRGKQRFFTLGRFGEITLQEAWSMALEHLGRARRGEDPTVERLADRCRARLPPGPAAALPGGPGRGRSQAEAIARRIRGVVVGFLDGILKTEGRGASHKFSFPVPEPAGRTARGRMRGTEPNFPLP